MKIGKLEVSPGFLLLAAWLNYVDQQGLFLMGMLSCFLHECGHILALHLLKNSVRKIFLTVHGAEILMRRSLSYRGEMLAAFAGPAVNFVLAGCFCRVPGLEAAAGLNLVLAFFNLLPIGALDGGRIFRCLLCVLFGGVCGEEIARRISCFVLCAACGAGVVILWMGRNLTLLLASVWLLRGISEKGQKRGRKSVK